MSLPGISAYTMPMPERMLIRLVLYKAKMILMSPSLNSSHYLRLYPQLPGISNFNLSIMKKVSFILLSLLVLVSCTKIIDIELNSATKRLVIEAKISDQSVPPFVKLTRTMDYFNPENPELVSGAIVTLRSDVGESEVMEEVSEGIYKAVQIKGTPGVTYSLTVQDGDQSYEADAYLPFPVRIDTTHHFIRENRTPRDNISGYMLSLTFTDPADKTNYYRLDALKINIDTTGRHQNGSTSTVMTSDVLYNGGQTTNMLNHDQAYEPGDTVIVKLISIDEKVYHYFQQLKESAGMRAMFSSSAPANPETNLQNGAMGYFAAESVDMRMVIISDQ